MFVILAKDQSPGSFMRLLLHMAGNIIRPDTQGFITNK
ncbi:hypothetical protein NNO_0559 [Hydrogenimonas sp.]|nr:hypothetical protein NNO_0559 [Hydrogenimonas sp.]